MAAWPQQFEITRAFRIPVQVIAMRDYPSFARFAAQIDDAERQRVAVERVFGDSDAESF